MKKLGILVLMSIVLLAGCGKSETTSTTASLTSSDYIKELKDAGLTIGEVIDYTAETDPNELLGRPNQYTSKTNFADASLNQDGSDDLVGGSVEVFGSKSDAENRKEYIDEIGKSTPMFAEYSYINGKALLRLNKLLTPDQAKQYEDAFMAIK